ncbi:BadF/BadG/BcrA/BcrD ATPase family protein [Allokutzneria albata]|uniref:BadF-type ATPase n=1 Tax=Allokutzneria albata TaxID=211114 RepID=A0A1G9R7S9_ALLAB|nr:BadF/BadG/BcrA/BcrD ATPase family protein [Allokutzneria albata]SDM19190.1 BadF-type ATPase [Allokutzneria albata]
MTHWAIDAGGSSTTALLENGTRWRRGSVNPASVGARAADDDLRDLFRAICLASGDRMTTGWLATATVDANAPGRELDRLTGLAREAGLTGTVVISRDIVPLLVAPPLNGRGVAVVCGTGSGFIAGDGEGEPVSVGGCEYLGSDEGSAFAIGLSGLRAGVRGTDGRGPATALSAALAELRGGSVQDLARSLAAEAFPKSTVAALSSVVCRCWLDGDAVAGEVVTEALTDMVDGVRAARDRAGLTGSWSVTLTGGVFQGCPEYAKELSARLVGDLGAEEPTLVSDPTAMVLASLRSCGTTLPRSLDGWAWTRSLGGNG